MDALAGHSAGDSRASLEALNLRTSVNVQQGMRTLIALALIASAAVAQDEPPKNKFLELNPGYRERAGGFYERTYLDSASASLAKAVALERFAKADAAGVLKQLIYDWLDAYVEGEGQMSRTAYTAVMKRVDASMKKLLDDDAAFKRWAEWRDSTNRELNPLAFLTSAKIAMVALALTVPDALAKDGWSMTSIEDDEQATPYKVCFPEVAHQVIVFEKGKGTRLALLVYRDGRAAELLGALEKAERDDVRVFWRTQGFLVFAAEKGTVPESLKEQLRRQLAKR